MAVLFEESLRKEEIMQTYTIGKAFYPGAEVPLKVLMNLKEMPEIPPNTAFQIIIIEEGTGIIRCDDKKIIIHAPYLFILNDEETIHLECLNDMRFHIVYFHPRILDNKFEFSYIKQTSRMDVTDPEVQDLYLFNSFLVRDSSLANHYKLTSIMLRRFLNLIGGIQEELENQETNFWICRGRSYLLEMLCYLSKFPLVAVPAMEEAIDSGTDILEKIFLFIHTYYAEKITLRMLVDHFHINRTTINDLFKKNTGVSIISYIIKLRIDASSLMLKDTGLPINEIAYRVGFEDMAHFSRSFRKMMNCSPSQYRKSNSWLLQHS